jgi:hypothetical protein
LAHGFIGFSPLLAVSLLSGCVVRQTFVGEGCGGAKLLTFGGQDAWRRREDKDKTYPLKARPH